MIDVIIPSIRPWEKLEMTLRSLSKHSRVPHLIHITSEGRSYAQAVNHAYKNSSQPILFAGADDLKFYPEWDTKIMEMFRNDKVMVVGTNDMHHPGTRNGTCATHYAFRRKYIELFTGTMDRSYPVLFDYKHNYTDAEFVAVAKARGVYAHAFESYVEHLHPAWGLAAHDAGYEKSQSTCPEDGVTYNKRRVQWTQPQVEIRG